MANAVVDKANNTVTLSTAGAPPTGSWTGGVVPTSTDVARWNFNATNTVGAGTGVNFGAIQITSVQTGRVTITAPSSGTFTLTGLATTVGGLATGTGISHAGEQLRFDTPVTIAAAQTWDTGGVGVYFGVGANVLITGSATVTKTGAATLGSYRAQTSLSSPILVNGGFLSVPPGSTWGSGKITLNNSGIGTNVGLGCDIDNGTATYANAVDIKGNCSIGFSTSAAGTIVNLSGAISIVSAATVTVNAGGSTWSNTVSGSGALTKAGTATLTLGVANTFSGTTQVTLGTLTISNVNGLQNSTVDWGTSTVGTLTLPASAVLGGLSTASGTANTFTRASAYSVGNNNGNATFSGVLAGAGNITKVGTGAWTLDGPSANTNTGTFTITAGTVNANKATALGAASSTAAITVSSGATLSAGAALSYSSPGRTTTISGTGVSSAGALVINHAGAVNVGAISLGAAVLIRGTADGGSLTSNITGTQNLTLGVDSGKTVTFSGTINTSTGTLTIGETATSTGTVVLSQASTRSGANTLTFGTVRVGNAAALGSGSITFNGGAIDASTTLTLTNSLTVSSNITFGGTAQLTLSSSVALGASRTITTNGSGGAMVLTNTVSGTGAKLTKEGTGTLKLTAANTYTGGTDINAGVVQAGNVQALVGTTGTVTLGASGTLQTLTTGGQNGKLTVASLNNAAGGTIRIGG